MEYIDIKRARGDVSRILGRESESYQDTKDAVTAFLEKEGPCRMRFAILAESFSHESRSSSLRWHDVDATAIAKERVPDAYGNKSAYNMVITFSPGEPYAVQTLRVHMTRQEKGSRKFVVSGFERISVHENGKSIGDVLRWYITTDYPEDHPIFAAMKNFNEPMERYQYHRAQAKLAQIDFEEKYTQYAEEVLHAVEERSSKRQKTD